MRTITNHLIPMIMIVTLTTLSKTMEDPILGVFAVLFILYWMLDVLFYQLNQRKERQFRENRLCKRLSSHTYR